MNKIFITALLSVVTVFVNAQTAATNIPTTQPFGKIDLADLELKNCDFEKDANAMVLFDVGDISAGGGLTRHLRIKIFNDFGKGEANFRLEYSSYKGGIEIMDLVGETFNLQDGKIETTILDKKQIYTQKIDLFRSAVVFALPNVKAGSVIEIKYRHFFGNTWNFQNSIPTRYSEIKIDRPSGRNLETKVVPHVTLPYVVDIGKPTDFKQVKAMANVHSLPNEPFMGARSDNLERLEILTTYSMFSSWHEIGESLQSYFNRDQKSDGGFSGEKKILDEAKGLKSSNEKIAFIYDQIKSAIKWNNILSILATNSPQSVWDAKVGNSAEINWLLYHALKKGGIKCYPLLIGDKQFTKLNPNLPSLSAVGSIVVCVPIDSESNYILDATDKFNLYNATPLNVLNTFGIAMDKDNEIDNEKHKMIFMENDAPVIQAAFINAEIKPDGKMSGTADLTNYAYNKIEALKKLGTDGEKKYIDFLAYKDQNLKIENYKLDNKEIDSLPLTQHFDFKADLPGADGTYIYFKPNNLNLFADNPFKNEERFSDIDFGYRDNFSISGVYKLPVGYRLDAMPPSVTIIMPDESIVFKRIVAENEGSLLVKYILDHKKSIYFKNDYQDIKGFYKKMYDLLNDQIVLKKG